MNIQEAFRILNIPPTRDRKMIKKAYAARTKEYHPEEYPQQWNAIHYAYEVALAYADSGEYGEENQRVMVEPIEKEERISIEPEPKSFEVPQENRQKTWSEAREETGQESWQGEQQKIRQKAQQETRELEQIFNQLEELAEEKKKDDREYEAEKLKNALERLKKLNREKKSEAEVWNHFFSTQEMEIMVKSEFLHQWDMGLTGLMLSPETCKVMKSWLERIAQEGSVLVSQEKRRSWEKSLQRIDRHLRQSGRRYHKKTDKPVRSGRLRRIPKGIAGMFVVLAFCVRIVRMLDRLEDRASGQKAVSPLETEVVNEEGDKDYLRENALVEYLKFLYIGQDIEEGKQRLRGQIENGILLREGMYLSAGDKTMPEDEFILTEVEVRVEDPEEGKEYYAFEVRSIRTGGPYILYIDTALLGLEECAVSHSLVNDDYWMEYDSWGDGGNSRYSQYYYQLENYLAIIVDVNPQGTAKEAFQIMLTGKRKEEEGVNT